MLSLPQIGNRFALTAAHCLYDDDNDEVLPASAFSIMLGVHDRSKAQTCISPSSIRRQIRVTKVLVHENFTDSANDIALLHLGRNISCDPLFSCPVSRQSLRTAMRHELTEFEILSNFQI